MVDFNKIAENLKAIPSEEQKAIVNLIQLKTEADMDRVLNKLNSMEAKFDAKFEAFDAKLEVFDTKLKAMENKFDAKLEAMETKFDTKFEAMDTKIEAIDSKFDILRWLLMAIIAIIPIALTIFGYWSKN
ncbi:DUF1640 domain-containing protein [Actinobacillus delphinicola]|uniref:Protein of uncharacterized function (DUF1640) n=1 Tax=Actinobacillus delphinicola TaxID=51161 RepID=A0A448TU90_9PAST|nr:DUF1640 domain-containing protein [Actinobacillus delphinicola]VEJ09401.1 Protein of uncharacterised function (DUF1640) [Actinobacillus delphinicola]